jgi:predicted esterase
MTQRQIHEKQPVSWAGEDVTEATAGMILMHGRGATAQDILSLAEELKRPSFAYAALQAANRTWYPYPFLAPVTQNEPYLSSALNAIDGLVAKLADAGLPSHRVILLGFSQGACLASEYVVRHPQRYGGLAALSGGLIGPPGTKWPTEGSLEETPIYLGCSDVDPHIPAQRVKESARVFTDLGASVNMRLYPGMAHTVTWDEIGVVRKMMDDLLAATSA